MNKRIIFFTGVFFIIAENFLEPKVLEAMYSPRDTCKTVYDTYKIICQYTRDAKIVLLGHKKNNSLDYSSPEGQIYVKDYNNLVNFCAHSQIACSAFPHYLIHPTMPGCVNSTIQIEYVLNCDRPERPVIQG